MKPHITSSELFAIQVAPPTTPGRKIELIVSTPYTTLPSTADPTIPFKEFAVKTAILEAVRTPKGNVVWQYTGRVVLDDAAANAMRAMHEAMKAAVAQFDAAARNPTEAVMWGAAGALKTALFAIENAYLSTTGKPL